MTYLVLSGVFLGAAALVALWAVAVHRRSGTTATHSTPAPFTWGALCAAALVLLVLTAVFDNLMIAAGLFTYADERISGLRLGLAPIEDFSYPVAAVVLLPALWTLFGRVHRRE
ncbi:lycopene cyclase domain-containing protein [Nesterenkonia ebinurensis]|uniref:lycopene cyclase domain-containing protein n=1 Tax=Nesterenkonia ebinurensis TaxID=2608252 RepID=UPI00123CA001|nr:lycopene cyclase domain-containing protein [Nesterenkonia ebinurensis]